MGVLNFNMTKHFFFLTNRSKTKIMFFIWELILIKVDVVLE